MCDILWMHDTIYASHLISRAQLDSKYHLENHITRLRIKLNPEFNDTMNKSTAACTCAYALAYACMCHVIL
jgi:hypothetical protein